MNTFLCERISCTGCGACAAVCAAGAIALRPDEEGIIKDVRIEGGCSGNLQGISRLVVGMKATDAIERMKGISCGGKPTSCPDQLSKALEQALEKAE